MQFVPVVDLNQRPLMPTTANRAARWIRSRKATPFWKRGVFCVRLNVEPTGRDRQEVAVGIDPGSKREGFTVKSEAHAFLNIQATAVDWVKDGVKTRREMRGRAASGRRPVGPIAGTGALAGCRRRRRRGGSGSSGWRFGWARCFR
jgi:RRXRR protein